MAKRPQRAGGRSDATGVPQQSLDVVASPVNTAVDPGLAGMPQAPNQTAAPVAPTNQDANNMIALSQSFGMLSNALARYDTASARADRSRYEWAVQQEELLDLQTSMTEQGIVFAKGIDQGIIDYADHPAAQRGLSEALGRKAARELNRLREEGYEQYKNTKEALSINHFYTGYDLETQSTMDNPPAGLAYSGAFNSGFLKQRSIDRERWGTRHNKWISGQLEEITLLDHQHSIQDKMNGFYEAGVNPEPVVEYSYPTDKDGNPIDGPPVVKNLTSVDPVEHRKEMFRQASASLTDWIDSQAGGVFGYSRLNEIAGMALISAAVETNDPEKAQFYMSLVKDVKTGPKGNRGSLYSGKVRDVYDKEISRVEQKISRLVKERIELEIQDSWENHVDDVVDGLADQITFDPLSSTNDILNQIQGGEITNDDGASLGKVYVEEGNLVFDTGIKRYTKSLSDITDQAMETARGLTINKFVKRIEESGRNLSPEQTEAEGRALASAELLSVDPALQSEMQRIPLLITKHRQNFVAQQGVDVDRAEMPKIKAAYSGYKQLQQNPALLDMYLPRNSEARTVLDTLDLIMSSSETGLLTGGATFESAYASLVEYEDRNITQQDWEDAGFDDLVLGEINNLVNVEGAEFANTRKIGDDVYRIAKVVYLTGAAPTLGEAVKQSWDYSKKMYVRVGRTLVHQDSIDKRLLEGDLSWMREERGVDVPMRVEERDFDFVGDTLGFSDAANTLNTAAEFTKETFSALNILADATLRNVAPGLGWHDQTKDADSWAKLNLRVARRVMEESKDRTVHMTLNEALAAAEKHYLGNTEEILEGWTGRNMPLGSISDLRLDVSEKSSGMSYEIKVKSKENDYWIPTGKVISIDKIVNDVPSERLQSYWEKPALPSASPGYHGNVTAPPAWTGAGQSLPERLSPEEIKKMEDMLRNSPGFQWSDQ